MSEADQTPRMTIMTLLWVETDILYVKFMMTPNRGQLRLALDASVFEGTPLEGWSSTWPPEDQWRATLKPSPEKGVPAEVIWVCGKTGAHMKETDMANLLMVAAEDMTPERRRELGSWGGNLIMVERGLHAFGAHAILDDLALWVPASRRQFNTKILLADDDIVINAMSLDGDTRFTMRPMAEGIEFELEELIGTSTPRIRARGLWPVRKIMDETTDTGFHDSLDRFITLSVPPPG